MEFDLIKNELMEMAEAIIENYSVPGLPENYVTFITKNVQIISGVNGLSSCLSIREAENAIQTNLAPMALLHGICANGIQRRTFINDASFDEPEVIMNNKNDDYELDEYVLNYIYSIISAVKHLDDLTDDEILMIQYSPEAGISCIDRFSNLADLEHEIYEVNQVEKLHN